MITMNCEEKNKFPFWEFVKKLPAFRFLKHPVWTVQQLYERYVDGLETGVFTFVKSKWAFYGWDKETKGWKIIGGDISMGMINELLKDYMPIAPNDGKLYAGSGNKWVEICEVTQPDIEFSVSPTVINLNSNGDEQSIFITTNTNWTSS